MAAYDVTALSSPLSYETSTTKRVSSMVNVPGRDMVAVAWYTASGYYAQCFSVNISTGALTAVGSKLTVTSSTGTTTLANSLVAIDTSNLAFFYNGSGSDGFVQLISVDGSGNLSNNGSNLEYDTTLGVDSACCLIDSTHILATWRNGNGRAAVFTFNTGAGTISMIGTPFVFTSGTDYELPSISLIDTDKALVAYKGTTGDGFARVLSINTSTWAVTAAGAEFEFFDGGTIYGTTIVPIDIVSSPKRVLIGWADLDSSDSEARSFSIDTSTWTITAFGSVLDLSTSGIAQEFTIAGQKIDTTHALFFYSGAASDGFARVVTFDPSTGNLSNSANEIEQDTDIFYNTSSALIPSVPGMVVCEWTSTSGNGKVQAFQVELPSTTNNSVMMHHMQIAGGLM